jgi:hypothetical protein
LFASESFISTRENTSARETPMVAPNRSKVASRRRPGTPSRGFRRSIKIYAP